MDGKCPCRQSGSRTQNLMATLDMDPVQTLPKGVRFNMKFSHTGCLHFEENRRDQLPLRRKQERALSVESRHRGLQSSLSIFGGGKMPE